MTSSTRVAGKRLRIAVLAGAALGALTPAAAQETLTYTYDGRGRLVKTVHSGTANNGVSSCYGYDAADNRTASAAATGGSACVASGGGTAPSFAINNASATEGGTVNFTVTRSGSTTGSYTLNYASANGTATAGSDYTAKSGTLTFGDGITSQAVSVTTLQDTTSESSETFYVDLSSASGGATITTSRGTGTINDDDSGGAGVTFSISSNGAVTEGASSVFTITKSGSATTSLTVNYATANGTAVAGSDYTAKSGTLTFTTSQTSQTVSVATTDDTTVENAETFTMSLASPSGGSTIGTGTATATVNDNDGSTCSGVGFASGDASATEGDPLVFTITKSGTTSSSCSVSYATENASAGSTDYTHTEGTLEFTSSQTSKTVSVPTNDDPFSESTETIVLRLSSPTGGSTVSRSGTGSILDNDSSGGCCQLQSTDPGTVDPSLDSTTITDQPGDPTTTTEPLPAEEPPPGGQASVQEFPGSERRLLAILKSSANPLIRSFES